ncbi:multidrug efflux RND transporter permease subunit [Azospirillum sp. RWY-5-1]|uniref:Efflux pump membrane transporter n=1 Tax=Azospirillum oleiclasticum TaxID=2735135 RepID=A0ABX2TC20_9PROT|nr:multidrug efflux RND transporter permease subunit [Azospirillum oleiclasticum]NYZ14113.1 multidrug efflux RND transporter permease subunit [Azospirillum oleiclasticum]NYZ21597.1 multidrug efflux RND transporter permease subunit [Azospirillum oleiclasticum]
MRFSHFFIDRPIFAAVVSIFITLIGAFAYLTLPVAQYPEIAPPTIEVRATYPGASAEVVSNTVATPMEQEINGVENMLYMVSQATGDGNLSLTITFALGTNLDTAQVLVQNRVAIAEPRLPEDVRRLGVTVRKNSPDMLMVIHISSPDGTRDQLYLSNYATLQVRDRLARLDGVGDVRLVGARDYAMRIWLDPGKVAARNLTAGEVVSALRAQNVQVASGVINQPPVPVPGAFQLNVETLGRLTDPRQFENIIVKEDGSGAVTRVRDIARVELAAQDYNLNGYLDDRQAVPILIFQRPGSNALETAERIQATMAELSQSFPSGLRYDIVYNPTEFIAESVKEVYKTIIEAVILVVIVVVLFLQTWRASIVPILAIPVSLIGTFTVLAALGYSLNNLSLFGLVLAIGIVVDDAIVVVENVETKLREGLMPREAAHRTMDEVGGALVAIALVLAAVFIPAAFVSGISGQFFRQFAVTIATATVISMIVSLTLSPALCAILFKPHHKEHEEKHSPLTWPIRAFFNGFNRVFDRMSGGYGGMTRRLVRVPLLVLAVYGGLLVLTGYQFNRAPTGFIPNQDQGYLITIVQLPPGSSLSRTDEVVRRATGILLETPGVIHAVPFAGLDGATFTNASNAGAIFATLAPYSERVEKGLSADTVLVDLRRRLGAIQEAFIMVVPPPPVRGIGNAGGFKMMVQDRRGRGLQALEQATNEMMVAANQEPGLTGVFTLFNTRFPKIFADIDRQRSEMLGVPANLVFEALEVYVGSAFVNDFNMLGRTFRVTAQADGPFRQDPRDIANLKTRNTRGEMVPIGSVAEFSDVTGPYRVTRFNLFPATELQGNTLPGVSTGQALTSMERLADRTLADGFGYEWTELAYQEKAAGSTGLMVFGLSVVFVFLLLAAQYESWALPLTVILIVPMCLLAAVSGLLARGMAVDVLAQVGFVVLVGLAAKNAILIVEFAKQAEEEGKDRFEAAVAAARARLRPILMTSFAFILGVVPLVIAQGAGAEMRQSLGTAVFFGMLGVTVFGLIFTPVFYTVVRGLFRPRPKPERQEAWTVE